MWIDTKSKKGNKESKGYEETQESGRARDFLLKEVSIKYKSSCRHDSY